MINKILASYLLFCCFIAIALKLGGVEDTFHLGTYFKSYLIVSNNELLNFKIAIPDIPKIDIIEDFVYDTGSWWDTILNAFHTFAVGFAKVINGIISVLNFLIMVINTIIQTIELIFIFLKNLLTMKDNIISA